MVAKRCRWYRGVSYVFQKPFSLSETLDIALTIPNQTEKLALYTLFIFFLKKLHFLKKLFLHHTLRVVSHRCIPFLRHLPSVKKTCPISVIKMLWQITVDYSVSCHYGTCKRFIGQNEIQNY